MAQLPNLKATAPTASRRSNAVARSCLRLRPPDVDPAHAEPAPAPALTSSIYTDFTRHRDEVVRYLTWLRVPKPAIDELTQDVFLVAHRRRSEFRGDSSVRTWLSGIAFHLVLNWRRRRKWREHWEGLTRSKAARVDRVSRSTVVCQNPAARSVCAAA